METCTTEDQSSMLGVKDSDDNCEHQNVSKPVSTDSTKSADASKTGCSGTDVEDLEKKFRMMKFDEYDFTKDEQFQSGWNKLSAVVPADQVEKQLLKAKLFYYSKHIEQIDIPEYLTWKSKLSDNTKTQSSIGENKRSKGDNSCSPTDTTVIDEEVSLTFSEVMECIQSGREIPGVKKIEIQTTDSDPSPSVLERKSKPWEHS